MIDQSTRIAILALKARGRSHREIGRALKVSRGAIRRVIASGSADVPRLERDEKAAPHRERILELLRACKGNLVRVHEELTTGKCDVSYQALTAFCRRHEIGKKPTPRAGQYYFAMGEEMQHDTSPHRVEISGTLRLAQAASLKFCHSRMIFFQYYPTFRRFDCKVFLDDALRYFGGSCKKCMIDNTHVVVLKGTGAEMIPVPEMAAFGEQRGFEFVAHEKGDANRSAHVERSFDHFDNNFNAGRKATDWKDLNRQALEWCDKVNAKHRRHLHASPRDLFAQERPHLRPLPEWVPEVYQIHQRLVDSDGYVSVNTNRYSVPLTVPIGRLLQARETKERVDLYEGPRVVASHERVIDPVGKRVTDASHRPRRERRRPERSMEEKAIHELAPELQSYVDKLKKRRGSTTRALRRLLSLLRDYPRGPVLAALAEAERFGLFDLDRAERMVLKRIAGDFFLLSDGDVPGGSND
jgi:transposase